jgi:dihydrodipicolinate synthase/N-acetylneuraminate lyase
MQTIILKIIALSVLYNELINNNLHAVFSMGRDFISPELTEEERKQLKQEQSLISAV